MSLALVPVPPKPAVLVMENTPGPASRLVRALAMAPTLMAKMVPSKIIFFMVLLLFFCMDFDRLFQFQIKAASWLARLRLLNVLLIRLRRLDPRRLDVEF